MPQPITIMGEWLSILVFWGIFVILLRWPNFVMRLGQPVFTKKPSTHDGRSGSRDRATSGNWQVDQLVADWLELKARPTLDPFSWDAWQTRLVILPVPLRMQTIDTIRKAEMTLWRLQGGQVSAGPDPL